MNVQSGRIGHWSMDAKDTDSGILHDQSAYDHHATINNASVGNDAGIVNDAYSFAIV